MKRLFVFLLALLMVMLSSTAFAAERPPVQPNYIIGPNDNAAVIPYCDIYYAMGYGENSGQFYSQYVASNGTSSIVAQFPALDFSDITLPTMHTSTLYDNCTAATSLFMVYDNACECTGLEPAQHHTHRQLFLNQLKTLSSAPAMGFVVDFTGASICANNSSGCYRVNGSVDLNNRQVSSQGYNGYMVIRLTCAFDQSANKIKKNTKTFIHEAGHIWGVGHHSSGDTTVCAMNVTLVDGAYAYRPDPSNSVQYCTACAAIINSNIQAGIAVQTANDNNTMEMVSNEISDSDWECMGEVDYEQCLMTISRNDLLTVPYSVNGQSGTDIYEINNAFECEEAVLRTYQDHYVWYYDILDTNEDLYLECYSNPVVCQLKMSEAEQMVLQNNYAKTNTYGKTVYYAERYVQDEVVFTEYCWSESGKWFNVMYFGAHDSSNFSFCNIKRIVETADENISEY